jgi:hypothetical protein
MIYILSPPPSSHSSNINTHTFDFEPVKVLVRRETKEFTFGFRIYGMEGKLGKDKPISLTFGTRLLPPAMD